MWVRAVAVAVAVVCCAGAVQAGQYAEVWNPPEARHAPKKIKVHAAVPAATRVAGKSVAGGGKGKQGKAASVHAARQAKPHTRLAAKGAPAGKTVKMARGKGAPGKPVKMAHAAGAKKAAVTTAHSGVTGHAQMAMRPESQKLASKAAPSTRPASAMASAAPRTAPVQPAATMANATASPATNSAAGGGNLPPILH
ncbi:hypothetical protein [Paraburkholderia sp. BCC1885]|uniref:hypothetical protein n=1 Tax=Paraburkholderia sp. BCC1885 TaxID=2562669 RepID=UPI00118218F9|nr:hypothetical protein [Paraburkholderia sp. BCC1885]